MKKVKVFKPMSVGSDLLESDINEWIIEQNVEVVDVKTNIFETINTTMCVVLVIYEEK